MNCGFSSLILGLVARTQLSSHNVWPHTSNLTSLLGTNLVSPSPAIWMTSVTAYSGSGEFYCSVFGDQICILGQDLHRKKYSIYEAREVSMVQFHPKNHDIFKNF